MRWKNTFCTALVNYSFFHILLLAPPFRARHSGSPATISLFPLILLFHTSSWHDFFHYIYYSFLWFSSFPNGWQCHIQHPLSAILPLHMSKSSLPFLQISALPDSLTDLHPSCLSLIFFISFSKYFSLPGQSIQVLFSFLSVHNAHYKVFPLPPLFAVCLSSKHSCLLSSSLFLSYFFFFANLFLCILFYTSSFHHQVHLFSFYVWQTYKESNKKGQFLQQWEELFLLI